MPQLVALLFGFDPFGNDLQVQGSAQLYERLNDGPGLGRHDQARDEGLVDLQHVDRELLEVGERREPGPEIVDRQSRPGLPEPQQAGDRVVRTAHQRGLRQLEYEPRRIEVTRRQGMLDVVDDVVPLQ